jgi:hypothetical protein
LCKVPSHSIDKETFRSIRDRLSAGANGTEALCEIDGAVVQAQQDCLSSQYLGDVELIAGLMHVLAHNWRRDGDLHRADQLFQAAYQLEEKAPGKFALGMVGLLRGWASLKVELASHSAPKSSRISRRNWQEKITRRVEHLPPY